MIVVSKKEGTGGRAEGEKGGGWLGREFIM